MYGQPEHPMFPAGRGRGSMKNHTMKCDIDWPTCPKQMVNSYTFNAVNLLIFVCYLVSTLVCLCEEFFMKISHFKIFVLSF